MRSDYNQKEEGYFELARPEIQQFIPENISTLLDVGCGTGEMAFQLKANKGVKEVWGIELVKSAGEKAAINLDKVLISPVEEAIEQLPNNYFDVITFADVLEHLVEPEKVLIEIKTKLKPNGQIITSIPNVRHWSIIQQLLEGEWKYEDYGLLDRTHLRFFTRKSALRLFESCGYQPMVLANKIVGSQVQISDSIIDKLIENKIDASTLKEEINHFQYLISARRKAKSLFVEIELLRLGFIDLYGKIPAELKENVEIIFLYEERNELTGFIENLSKSNQFIKIEQIDNYKNRSKVDEEMHLYLTEGNLNQNLIVDFLQK